MTNIALRQVRAVIAVCEEGSFTRAAERENATQSGISQHVATGVERALGVKLFERSARGHRPDAGGTALLQELRRGGRTAGGRQRGGPPPWRPGRRRLAHRADADLHPRGAGADARRLRAALSRRAPARLRRLQRRADRHGAGRRTRFRPRARFEGRVGLKPRLLVRDREMLLSGAKRGLKPPKPVRLADCAPLKIGAGAGQRPPPQPRNLLPDPRRRDRRPAGNGRHDRHARIRRPLRLGHRAAEPHFGERHRQGRPRGQSDRRPAAARRIRRHPAGAAHLERWRGCFSSGSMPRSPTSTRSGTGHWRNRPRRTDASAERDRSARRCRPDRP